MLIRKLEIHGFKSFPDRVVFHFSEGISGVVGPNGCGKSNVLDAIKWCIGEQSPKELRGQAMEDIVFNGSDARASMNIAQVSLTFAAGDRPFAGEWARYDEVVVTRKLARGGGSEYRVNQQRVRLRDVHDLFLDTGAGSRFYSFIEQGRIGTVVGASPLDRRSLVEEAAGTSRFKARRAETIRRLDATLENLQRSVHVVEELELRLEQLGRQVDRAARFRRLRAIVRQGSLFLALVRYAALMADRRVLNADKRAAKLDLERRERSLKLAERDLARDKEQATVAEHVVGGLRDQLAELEAKRRELESARQYQQRERVDLEGRAERLARETQQGQQRIQDLEGELASCEAQLEAAAQRDVDARTAAAEQEERTQAVASRLRDLRQERERQRRALLERRAALERARTKLDGLRRLRERTHEDLEGHHRELGAARAEAVKLEQAQAEARARLEQAKARGLSVTEALRQAQQALRACEDAAQRAGERSRQRQQEQVAAERDLAVKTSQRDALRQLRARHEGLTDASRRVLADLPEAFAMVEELDVADSLLEPLAAALGDRANLVVVPDLAALERAVALAEGGAAWLLVQPGTDCRPLQGFLAEIGGTERARRALSALLGRCERCDDLSRAVELAREGATVVTPAGQRVEPGGLVRHGRSGGDVSDILGRRRALEQADGIVAEQAERSQAARLAFEEASGRLAEAREKRDGARQDLASHQQAHRRAELEQTGCQHRVQASAAALERQQALLAELEQRAGQQQGRVRALEADIEGAEGELRSAEQGIGAAGEAMERAEDAVRGVAGEHATLMTELQRLRETLAALVERIQAARQARGAASRALEQARLVVERARQEAERVATRQAELVGQASQTERDIDRVAKQQDELAGKLEHERRNLAEARRRVQRSEDAVSRSREQRDAGTQQLQKVELELKEARTRIDLVKKQGQEELGVSLPAQLDRLDKNRQLLIPHGLDDDERLPLDLKRLPTVDVLVVEPRRLEDTDFVDEWTARVERSRKRLANLGDVNLTAVEEYLEVQARHEEIMAQRRDLEASVAEIRSALARINRTCRERFRVTFDQVNTYFGEIYERLSSGGKGRLVLTDEDDLLETGVDIAAVPPGKRVKSMTLMSGGEKALVAIAMVFALFRVRPSPFCVLDEVDAPLDEGNGARFNDLLRDMARSSQFIVITHKKKTIECADTLYGVTMQDAGVSKLVTVRVH